MSREGEENFSASGENRLEKNRKNKKANSRERGAAAALPLSGGHVAVLFCCKERIFLIEERGEDEKRGLD